MMLLNLTSPDAHKVLKIRANIAIARTITLVMVLAVLAFSGSSLFGSSLLEKKAQDAQQEADRSTLLLNAQGQASITETTKRLNMQVAILQKVQKRYVQWTPYIENFSKLTPEGITLKSLHFSQATGKITFEAKADTRDNYVNYEKVLQTNTLYKDVEFDLQTKKVDIDFSDSVTLVNLPKQ